MINVSQTNITKIAKLDKAIDDAIHSRELGLILDNRSAMWMVHLRSRRWLTVKDIQLMKFNTRARQL